MVRNIFNFVAQKIPIVNGVNRARIFLRDEFEYRSSIRNINRTKKKNNDFFVIVSKDEFAGTSKDDVADPLKLTEIATELVITRLFLIDLLNSGKISSRTTVVCAEQRKALYKNLFVDVVSYQDFKDMKIKRKYVVDLLGRKLFSKLANGPVSERLIPYLPFYQNWDRDKDEILNFQYSTGSYCYPDEPFVALVIRKRGAWPEKNLPDDFWLDVISGLNAKGILVYVFGKESDSFCLNSRTIFVRTFQDWCTLVTSPNCLHVGSTMTGGVYPLLVFGNPNSQMTIVDNTGLMPLHGGDPSFYSECINFSKIRINFISHVPTSKEYLNAISRNI